MIIKKDHLSVNITVREEQEEKNKIFIVNNEETGIADFGNNLKEAINNFKKSLNLYLEAYPEKRKLFIEEKTEPILVSRIFL